MRDIKFRGKRVDNGEWVLGDLIKDSRTWYFIKPPDNVCYGQHGGRWCGNHYVDRVDPETVGQFTGLLDKKGKEIYEGDILQSQIGDKNVWKVLFDDGSFVIEQIKSHKIRGKKKHAQDFCCADDIELYQLVVIGNLHDNPELLEVA